MFCRSSGEEFDGSDQVLEDVHSDDDMISRDVNSSDDDDDTNSDSSKGELDIQDNKQVDTYCAGEVQDHQMSLMNAAAMMQEDTSLILNACWWLACLLFGRNNKYRA